MLNKTPLYLCSMEIETVREKYLNKMVCHMATGLTFEICDLVQLGILTKDKIELIFQHPTLKEIPMGQQCSATLREIEVHYRIVC